MPKLVKRPTKRGAKKPVSMPVATRKRYSRNDGDTGGKFFSSIGGNGLVQALGGYGGSRLTGRILRRLMASKPGFAKHAGPAGNLLATIAIYFAVKNWKKLREEALIGAIIALVQSVLQSYVPGLSTMLLDAPAPMDGVALPPQASAVARYQQQRRRGNGVRYVSPGELQANADDQGVRYVSPGEAGSGYGGGNRAAEDAQQAQAQTSGDATFSDDDEQIADLGENETLEDLQQGIFAQ